MTATGQFTILQAALPGAPPENIGVLLVDGSGSAHVKIRRDLHSVAEEDDAEYLEALGFDLRQKAAELGGRSLLRWLVENASNFLQVSDPEETAVHWPEADLRRIYSEHVHARVLPFQTHLPQYTLAAAAGSWGEAMEVRSGRLGRSARRFTAHGGHVRRPRRGPVDGAPHSGRQPVRLPAERHRIPTGPSCPSRELRRNGRESLHDQTVYEREAANGRRGLGARDNSARAFEPRIRAVGTEPFGHPRRRRIRSRSRLKPSIRN